MEHASSDEQSLSPAKQIAIIGAGFTGSTIAIHQINTYLQAMQQAAATGRPLPPVTIHLIEQTGTFGPGLPYSMADDTCKLNQDADEMSPFPDQPRHFTAWLNEHGPDRPYSGAECVSRKLYGEYLAHNIDTACAAAHALFPHGGIRVEKHHAQIEGIKISPPAEIGQPAVQLTTRDGQSITADSVVVATGHSTSNLLQEMNGYARYTSILKTADGMLGLQQTDDLIHALHKNLEADAPHAVAIMGNGQSMMDILVALKKMNYTGQIFLISDHKVAPWLYDREHYATPQPPYALQHFHADTIFNTPPDERLPLGEILEAEIEKGRQQGRAPGHVLGEVHNHLFGACLDVEQPTAALQREMRGIFVKKYGNPTCQAHYDLYQEFLASGQLLQVRGRIENAGQISEDLHGLHIGGLKEAQNLYVQHLFNSASMSRDCRSNGVIEQLYQQNVVEMVCDVTTVREPYQDYVHLAGVPISPHKYGVGTFRTGNARIAQASMLHVLQM